MPGCWALSLIKGAFGAHGAGMPTFFAVLSDGLPIFIHLAQHLEGQGGISRVHEAVQLTDAVDHLVLQDKHLSSSKVRGLLWL